MAQMAIIREERQVASAQALMSQARLFAEPPAWQEPRPETSPPEALFASGDDHESRPASWTSVPLTLNSRGFLKNEREQYNAFDSIRELINNQYDAGATEVHIDVSEDEIRISGNGHPIDDPSVLTEVFTDVKRGRKVIKDVSGKRRRVIGEKGRGRFAFVKDADEMIVASRFGEFKLSVTKKDEIKASIWRREHTGQQPPSEPGLMNTIRGMFANIRRRGRSDHAQYDDSGTVVTVRKRKGEFNVESIRNYIAKNYRYFDGMNFRISFNGEDIPMVPFRPDVNAWLVVSKTYIYGDLKDMIEDRFPSAKFHDGSVIETNYAGKLSPLLIFDRDIADYLANHPESKYIKIYRVDAAFSPKDDADHFYENLMILQQLNPVSARTGHSSDFPVNMALDTDLPLDPSRKAFASHDFLGGSVDGNMIERALGNIADRALEYYFEAHYKDRGWHRYHEFRTPQVLTFRYGWMNIPDLEVKVKHHENGSTVDRIKTLAELAEASKALPVISYNKQHDDYSDAIDRMIQRGHLGLYSSVSVSTNILRSHGIKFIEPGDPAFNELMLKYGNDISEVGAEDNDEQEFIDVAQSALKHYLGSPPVELVIATVLDPATRASFQYPNIITFNRKNDLIKEVIEHMSVGNISEYGSMMAIAPTLIHELAHYYLSNNSNGASRLEHEKLAVREKDLYEKFLREMSWDV
jgi:hypothetical protein